MGYIDLHTHSFYSDGTLSPSQLLQYASETGLSAVALTDHDTVQGLEEAKKAAATLGMEFVPGIELAASCDTVESELHILGLYIDGGNEELGLALIKLRDGRQRRNRLMFEALVKTGVDAEYAELVKASTDGLITRAHFAQMVVKKGYARDAREAMHKYFLPGCPAYISRIPIPPRECIRLIHCAGGLAFLAHPTRYGLNYTQIDRLAAQLKEIGLDGIEAYYSTYSNEDTARMATIAHKHKLLRCGGSDFHGENKAYIELGSGRGGLRIPYSVLEAIKQRLTHSLPKDFV